MPPQTTVPTPTPQPAAPTPTPQAPEVAPQPPANSPVPPGSANSSKKFWLIALIVGIIILVMSAAVVALYFMFFSPAAVTKRVSTEFMKAAAAGDAQKLYEITNSTTAEEKAFLDAAAAATKGEYTLKDGTMQDGKGYYLYDLTNETGKMSRTTVEKKDGKYVVTGYVFGSDNLALIPGTSEALPAPTPSPSTDPAPASETGACLVKSDYSAYGSSPFFITEDPLTYRTNIFFTSGTTDYTSENSSNEFYAHSKTFATENAGKQYTFKLTGVVKGTNQAANEQQLSNERAEKVKQGLIAAGVPESQIEITAPSKDTSDARDANRTVDINVVATCKN